MLLLTQTGSLGRRRLLILPLIGLLPALALVACSSPAASQPEQPTGVRSRTKVTALARIEPGEGVLDLGAAAEERVARLEAHEGDEVAAGNLLAVLDSHAERVAEVAARAAQVEETHLRLARLRTIGPLHIAAAEVSQRLLETELVLEEAELTRAETLRSTKSDTAQAYDRQLARTLRAREAVHGASLELEQRRQDHRLALVEVEAAQHRAEVAVGKAQARLARSEIRAPVAGRVLQVFRQPGEVVGRGPILRFGETARMYAVAEVFEGDVGLVEVGQHATVTSAAFAEALEGKVERIGRLIYRNDVLDLDPGAATDSRIVEVRIRLDENRLAERYIHLQVDVSIELASP